MLSQDDDDDNPEVKVEREKLRRQQNNARERLVQYYVKFRGDRAIRR